MTNVFKNNILGYDMVQIDVRKLNAKKQYAGDLSFTYVAADELISIPFVQFSAPVDVKLHYEILEDDSVEVTGAVRFKLKGNCSRCLKETQREFTGEVDAYFVTQKTDSEDYFYQNTIDLTGCLNDAVMIAMPFLLECGEECVSLAWKEQ